MPNNKKILIIGILLLVIFLSGGYISMDWLRFYYKPERIEFLQSPFSPYMKVFVSFLAFLTVWLIGRDYALKKDSIRLKLAFTFIFIADLAFLMNFDLAGVAIFALCQLLLIYRNGYGILEFFRCGEWAKYKIRLIIYAAISIMIGVLSLLILFRPILKGNSLYYLFVVYASLLCISLWTALVSRLVRKLPGFNTFLIALGMIFFILCDFTVGMNIALDTIEKTSRTEFVWMVSSSLTWMFYTPALVLLALSGYDTGRIFDK